MGEEIFSLFFIALVICCVLCTDLMRIRTSLSCPAMTENLGPNPAQNGPGFTGREGR